MVKKIVVVATGILKAMEATSESPRKLFLSLDHMPKVKNMNMIRNVKYERFSYCLRTLNLRRGRIQSGVNKFILRHTANMRSKLPLQ